MHFYRTIKGGKICMAPSFTFINVFLQFKQGYIFSFFTIELHEKHIQEFLSLSPNMIIFLNFKFYNFTITSYKEAFHEGYVQINRRDYS